VLVAADREGALSRLTASSPACYRITVNGGLDETWSERFGMQVNVALDTDRCPVTTLTGEVLDQAMLLGVLNYIFDLGMPIIMVECLDTGKV
jgi:hypothetical protein